MGMVELELIIWTLLSGLVGVLSTDYGVIGNIWWWYGGQWEKRIFEFITATFIHFTLMLLLIILTGTNIVKIYSDNNNVN